MCVVTKVAKAFELVCATYGSYISVLRRKWKESAKKKKNRCTVVWHNISDRRLKFKETLQLLAPFETF